MLQFSLVALPDWGVVGKALFANGASGIHLAMGILFYMVPPTQCLGCSGTLDLCPMVPAFMQTPSHNLTS